MPRLEAPLIVALNHLLREESWARARLAPFEGAVIRLSAGPLPALFLRVADGGLLTDADAADTPRLMARFDPATLLSRSLLSATTPASESAWRLDGDAALGDAVRELITHLRWDGEEALSRILGDAVAHRVASAGHSFAAWNVDAARRLAQSASFWVREEKDWLVPASEYDAFRVSLRALDEALERLEKRLS